MKRSWRFLPAAATASAHEPEHVLEETDGAIGALVASFTEAGQRFVGVAVDRKDGVVRWIESPVSDLEWDSLLRGFTSLRDVLLEEEVWVIDRTVTLESVRSWRVAFSQLEDEHLPAEDSLLDPEDHEHLLAPPSRMPQLHDVPPVEGSAFFPRDEGRAA